MKKTVIALLLAVCAGTAGAADTYGYLVMWQNPADGGSAVQLKTTKENASQLEANAELEAFCRAQDTLSGVQQGRRRGVSRLFRFTIPVLRSLIRKRKEA